MPKICLHITQEYINTEIGYNNTNKMDWKLYACKSTPRIIQNVSLFPEQNPDTH